MITEKIIIGENSKYPLNGCLTFPTNTEFPVPAVVFVHGSGSSNMDEKVGKLTPFKDLAEGLAEHGIASIRYDKRSFAHGFKMLKDKKLIITAKEETIDDAILATEFLGKDSRIDSNNIYIIGHSMGGMLAPRIDSEGGNYKGLIIMAGTARRLEDVLIDQTKDMSNSMNPLLQKLINKQVVKYTKIFRNLYEITDDEAKHIKFGGGTTLYYFKEMGEKTVEHYLKSLNKPILFMQGERDVQVDMEKDFGLYKELMSNKENASFLSYDNLNHAFVPALYDSIAKAKKEFQVERHIGPEVIEDIANWIHTKGV